MKLRSVPWQAKIIAKLVISRLPFKYPVWRRLGIFRHGAMENPEYAHKVFLTHFNRLQSSNYRSTSAVLEIGPGDSLFSAVLGRSFGISKTVLVDVGDYAKDEIRPYRRMCDFLIDKQLPVPELKDAHTLEDILTICGAKYHTNGLASLRSLKSDSIDLIWSQAVLEHIRKIEFDEYVEEMRRLIRPDGICSHRVDLRDHLGGALNNLRFSDKLWESDWMARSGFYTNRIRFRDMLDSFSKSGFQVQVLSVDRWKELPTPKEKLARPFRHRDDDDLKVAGFDVILRPV